MNTVRCQYFWDYMLLIDCEITKRNINKNTTWQLTHYGICMSWRFNEIKKPSSKKHQQVETHLICNDNASPTPDKHIQPGCTLNPYNKMLLELIKYFTLLFIWNMASSFVVQFETYTPKNIYYFNTTLFKKEIGKRVTVQVNLQTKSTSLPLPSGCPRSFFPLDNNILGSSKDRERNRQDTSVTLWKVDITIVKVKFKHPVLLIVMTITPFLVFVRKRTWRKRRVTWYPRVQLHLWWMGPFV